MAVQVGDTVKIGQVLFSDKKTPGLNFVSPGGGRVVELNRGAKRAFQSLVIELSENEESVEFTSYKDADLTTLTRDQVSQNLVDSGLWTAFRTRPYSKVPQLGTAPHSIFVTAIDTNPLAPIPHEIIEQCELDFNYGLQVIRHLTDGTVFLCKALGTVIPGEDLPFVKSQAFDGPHPAGLPGTHIHFLDPVSENKTVWSINYQDVIAIGKLFVTGKLSVERLISLAGPSVTKPRLIKTRLGASTDDLVDGQLKAGNHRVISGSVLSGRTAGGPFGYLGRYHIQVSVLPEGDQREFLGWLAPGLNKSSVKPVFASAWAGAKQLLPLTTSLQGSRRAMVPVGSFEKVMPLDILPTYLLRALIVGDTEQAQALGCLELDEEDLALCTYVSPGKFEFGTLLRKNLTLIEKEG